MASLFDAEDALDRGNKFIPRGRIGRSVEQIDRSLTDVLGQFAGQKTGSHGEKSATGVLHVAVGNLEFATKVQSW